LVTDNKSDKKDEGSWSDLNHQLLSIFMNDWF
jgi:hypothetical protein